MKNENLIYIIKIFNLQTLIVSHISDYYITINKLKQILKNKIILKNITKQNNKTKMKK